MATKIITHGKEIDKAVLGIHRLLEKCRAEEERLTQEGCQAGNINWKTDRPNTMFIYEPSVDGRRKYIHVGTDPKKQAEAEARVERWRCRDKLRKAISALEDEIKEMDWRLHEAVEFVNAVHEHARVICERREAKRK